MNLKDTISQKIAKLLPKNIVYFAIIRAWAKATTGKYSNQVVPDVTMEQLIKRWEE